MKQNETEKIDKKDDEHAVSCIKRTKAEYLFVCLSKAFEELLGFFESVRSD
jgi:hypothetical protein